MKLLSIYITLVLLLIVNQSIAQVIAPSVVSNLKVINKASGSATTTVGHKMVVKVRPEITVSLKNADNLAKIYLEILEKDSLTVVYKANYNVNSSSVVQSNVKLFERDNLNFHFSTPSLMNHDRYLYKILTEDGSGNLSKEFIQQK